MQRHPGCPRGGKRNLSRLIGDQNGAMFIEAVAMCLPVIALFFMTWEVGELAAADLVLAQAVRAAAHKAAVAFPADPKLYGGEQVRDRPGTIMSENENGPDENGRASMRYQAIKQVAMDLLSGAAPRFVSSSVRLELELATGTEPDVVLVHATLRAAYRCVGGHMTFIVCGASGTLELSKTASDVVQTARYQYAHSSPTRRSVPANGLLAARGG